MRRNLTAIATISILIAAALALSQDKIGEPAAAGTSPEEPAAKAADPTGVPRLNPPEDLAPGTKDNAGQPSLEPPVLSLPSGASPGRAIRSGDVIVSWSAGNDVIWGFSKSTGKWARQAIDPPASGRMHPTAAQGLAVLRIGTVFYAYSGEISAWDVLRLPADHKPDFDVQQGVAVVHDGEDIYTFAASTGRWSSPKDSAEAADSKPIDPQIKIFALRNAKANDARHLVEQLFRREIQSVVSDPRSNSLIVRGPPEQLNTIYAILVRLDEELRANPTAAADGQRPASPGGGDTGTIGSSGAGLPSPTKVAELSKQYDAKEQEAAKLARQIRELQPAPDAHKPLIEELTAKLRRAVADAFAARQKLHQAEAAQLQQRIAGIQQNLQIRQKLSDQIIDRRVKDLLNPDLQWETGAPPASGTSATGSPAQGGSASGSAAASNLPAAREYRDKLLERWHSIERLYHVARYDLEDLLRSASDLGEAELAAADGQGERRVAREKHVRRLKAIKSTVDAKFEEGLEPEYHKLAADAELLNAENLLAAESGARSTSTTATGRQPSNRNDATRAPPLMPPQSLTVSSTGELQTIRSADDFRRQLHSFEKALRFAEQSDTSDFKGKTTDEKVQDKQQIVEARRRDLAFLRDEYAAQLRLLELEVQSAKGAVESTQQQFQVAYQALHSGRLTQDNVIAARQAVQEAKLRADRATTLLDLYRKADPKNAPSAPSADPSTAVEPASR